MEWADWNGSLLVWYGEQPLPYIEDENDWQELANAVSGNAFFGAYGMPSPEGYDKWQDWAAEVTEIINGRIKLEPT